MRLIKCLVEDIEEELEGAEHYIKAQKASGYEAPASMQAVGLGARQNGRYHRTCENHAVHVPGVLR